MSAVKDNALRTIREGQGFDFEKLPVVCPAGAKVCLSRDGSPGVRCRIEEHTVTARKEPSSLAFYCQGDYTACSSWRADKHNRWAQKRLIDMNFPKRPGLTLLDQDPETVPSFVVPRD